MTHPVTPTAAVSGSVSFQYRSNVSRFKAAVCMNVHWSLWRAVRRLKHPTCPVQNVYHKLPGPAHACPPRTGQAARITSAPLFAPAVSMNVHRGLWRAVRRLKHPTCLVRNVYHRLPGPVPACPPPAGQAPQFLHLSRAPLLCMDLRRKDFSRDQSSSPLWPINRKSTIQ
jgi:hypothetical protein